MTSQFGLSQIIKEATHILESSSSCIDLIFTTQPNLVVESGVHPSLHPNCHHQIVFAKFNLQIYYPTLYPQEIQPWELGKKYDGNFLFTFGIVKVRYSGITTAKIFKHGNYLK